MESFNIDDFDIYIIDLLISGAYDQLESLYSKLIINDLSVNNEIFKNHLHNHMMNNYTADGLESLAKFISIEASKKDINENMMNLFEYIGRIAIKFQIRLIDAILFHIDPDTTNLKTVLRNIWRVKSFRSSVVRTDHKNFDHILTSPIYRYFTQNYVNSQDMVKILDSFITDPLLFGYIIRSLYDLVLLYDMNLGNHRFDGDPILRYKYMDLLITLWNRLYKEYDNSNMEIESLTDFNIIKTKNDFNKLTLCMFYSIHTFYSELYQLDIRIDQNISFLINQLFPMLGDRETRLKIMKKEIATIINDSNIRLTILDVYHKYLENIDRFSCNEIDASFIQLIENMYNRDKKEENLPTSTLNDIASIVEGCNGRITNPHIRFSGADILMALIPVYGYNKIVDPVETLGIYLSDVNFFDWTDPIKASVHYAKIIDCIAMVSDYYSYNSSGLTVDLCFRAIDIASGIMKIMNDILERLKQIQNQITHNQVIALFREETSVLLESIAGSLRLFGLVAQNRNDLMHKDVVKKFVLLVNILINEFTMSTHPIYTVSKQLITPREILNFSMDILLTLFKANKITVKDLDSRALIDIIKTLSFKDKDELIQYLSENIMEIEYPDEFTDQLFVVPIDEPVMIPNTDGFFDKTMLRVLLRSNPSHPFSREHLSVEELDEFNSRPDVISKLDDFRERFNKWKKENSSH